MIYLDSSTYIRVQCIKTRLLGYVNTVITLFYIYIMNKQGIRMVVVLERQVLVHHQTLGLVVNPMIFLIRYIDVLRIYYKLMNRY